MTVSDADYRKMMKDVLMHVALRYEFLAAPGMTANIIRNDDIATAATDGTNHYFNANYMASLTFEERVGLCLHENGHDALGHSWRMGDRDPEFWNIAADLTLNEWLRQAGATLPKGAIYATDIAARLAQAGCPPHERKGLETMATEEAYDLLRKYMTCDNPGGNPGNQPNRKPKGKLPKPGPGEVLPAPASDDKAEKIAEQMERMQVTAERVMKQEQQRQDRGERVVSQIPGFMREMLKAARQNKVDWRSATWRFVAGEQPGDAIYSKPNKKYVDDGIIMPVIEKRGVGNIAVCVDTSGSINEETVSTFLAEVQAILDTVQPQSITLIPCDMHVIDRQVEVLQPGDLIEARNWEGGGGTSFVPPFDYLDRHNVVVDRVIYLTDMMGTFPKDPGIPTLWVSTSNVDKAPFGDVISIKVAGR